jgi:hypothetical protein
VRENKTSVCSDSTKERQGGKEVRRGEEGKRREQGKRREEDKGFSCYVIPKCGRWTTGHCCNQDKKNRKNQRIW